MLQKDCVKPPAPMLKTNGYVLTASAPYTPVSTLDAFLDAQKKQSRGERIVFHFRKDETDTHREYDGDSTVATDVWDYPKFDASIDATGSGAIGASSVFALCASAAPGCT